MNIVSKHLDHFIRWFKMVVLSIFFGKFPRLVYSGRIGNSLEYRIGGLAWHWNAMFDQCAMFIVHIIAVITSVSLLVFFSHEIYRVEKTPTTITLLVVALLIVIAQLMLVKYLWVYIREISTGIKSRLDPLYEALRIVNGNDNHHRSDYYIGDIDTMRSLKKWLKENRPAYEAGECREWEIVCSFMDVAWPRIAEDVRLYITSELSSVAISEWSYKLRVIRVNRRVSVKDLKKILTNKKGLVERPEDSTIFTCKAFSEHKEHQFFEFKDVSLDVPDVSLGSTTLNRLKFEKTEELETEGVLVFDKEDNSGFLEEESYVVFFTKR